MSNSSKSVKAVKSLRLATSAELVGNFGECEVAGTTAGRLWANTGEDLAVLRAAVPQECGADGTPLLLAWMWAVEGYYGLDAAE